MNRQDIPKLYYSISEVSKIAGVDQHVLRYWETEFKELSPRKNRSGKRLYRDNDLTVVKRIKELLYTDRYTIEGAKRRLKIDLGGKKSGSKKDDSGDNKSILGEVRKGLLEVKGLLER